MSARITGTSRRRLGPFRLVADLDRQLPLWDPSLRGKASLLPWLLASRKRLLRGAISIALAIVVGVFFTAT